MSVMLCSRAKSSTFARRVSRGMPSRGLGIRPVMFLLRLTEGRWVDVGLYAGVVLAGFVWV
jgi:hypothetical protein